ncbi:MAG: polyprenyl synthetase family protein [Gemmataceae bacterium]
MDAALSAALNRSTAEAPPAVVEAMRYSLLAPGKRLRPLLSILACEASGGNGEQALPGACAVEMVHTYSLIHDDLPAMDDDDLRRGLPTCHVKFGEALAILAGDALLTLAFEVLGSGYAPPVAAVACVELARGAGAAGMVGGQVLDLQADGKIEASVSREPPASAERLETIHRLKTGALFRSALRLGVYAAHPAGFGSIPPATLASVDAFAAAFGLAFQVTDDLLDVESTAETAGKRVGKDAARGKLTYPGLLGVGASRAKADALGRQAVAAPQMLSLVAKQGPGWCPGRIDRISRVRSPGDRS